MFFLKTMPHKERVVNIILVIFIIPPYCQIYLAHNISKGWSNHDPSGTRRAKGLSLPMVPDFWCGATSTSRLFLRPIDAAKRPLVIWGLLDSWFLILDDRLACSMSSTRSQIYFLSWSSRLIGMTFVTTSMTALATARYADVTLRAPRHGSNNCHQPSKSTVYFGHLVASNLYVVPGDELVVQHHSYILACFLCFDHLEPTPLGNLWVSASSLA